MPFAFASTLIAATLAVTNTAPSPGEVKQFRDWIVACDNGGRCEAQALPPENAPDGAPVLSIIREPDADSAPEIAFPDMDRPPEAGELTIDGRAAPTEPMALALALSRGLKLTVPGDAESQPVAISLRGSAAALRYIDVKQKRAGTMTAMVARGRRTLRPSDWTLPVIKAPQLYPATIVPSADWMVRLAETSACKDERTGVTEDRAFSLGGVGSIHKAIVLIGCGSGAYNFLSAIYIGRYDSERPEQGWIFAPARTDFLSDPEMRADGAPVLINADWDEEGGTLSTFAKARGIGDCGNADSYAWDGEQLRLTGRRNMPVCRGSIDWPTVWRARVERGQN